MSFKILNFRLYVEQSKKEQLEFELERDRETIEQLEMQLLAQSEQVRLSLQLSQELENRKEWLAEEESRLEQTLIETQMLQQSLRNQQVSLEAREQVLAESLKQKTESRSRNESRHEKDEVVPFKSETLLRDEIRGLREFKSELVRMFNFEKRYSCRIIKTI
jgi:chromosome segregation ATPase